MLMIGICGASGSGKSTLAKELANKRNQRCVYLKQDSYYKDHPDMSFEERERINYDEPSAFEYEALLADLHELRAGRPITTKNYDYSQHRRCDSTERIEPADVVLLEGIHVFYDEAVRDLLDFKIFIAGGSGRVPASARQARHPRPRPQCGEHLSPVFGERQAHV